MVYIVDWTTQQKRNAMANMIAAVLACPEKKCHLWYHVFSPEDMSTKQITGFMVSSHTFCMYLIIVIASFIILLAYMYTYITCSC